MRSKDPLAARLQAWRKENADQAEQAGQAAGAIWAAKNAHPAELTRLARAYCTADNWGFLFTDDASDGSIGLPFCKTIDPNNDHLGADAFWKKYGPKDDVLFTEEFVCAFAEAAIDKYVKAIEEISKEDSEN